jgi:hypothetical protein
MVFVVNKKLIIGEHSLTWYNHTLKNISTITNDDLAQLMLNRNDFINYINSDEIVEISIKDFMNLPNDIKPYYECYTLPLTNGIKYRRELINKYSKIASKISVKINDINYKALKITKGLGNVSVNNMSVNNVNNVSVNNVNNVSVNNMSVNNMNNVNNMKNISIVSNFESKFKINKKLDIDLNDLQFLYRSCGYSCFIKNSSLIIIDDNRAKLNRFIPIITQLEEDDYYGFMIDSNHRFIGAGFNVLRNSGKTYSMLGDNDNMGLIPRICNDLFKQHNKSIEFKMEISYMEIYAEKVNDLLQKDPSKSQDLKIKTHNDYGPYVDNLTKILVSNYDDIINYINIGNKTRKVKSTLMNEYSSRSHAILTVYFTQIMLEFDDTAIKRNKTLKLKTRRELQSKINLVDLAGSERIDRSGVVGLDMKDAININKSLTQLGLVISELSKRNFTTIKRKIPNTNVNDEIHDTKKRNNFISFRDSKLTWILKESLGGNSKTFMLANISASSKNYHETLSTLRYASNAKKIINKVKIKKKIKLGNRN